MAWFKNILHQTVCLDLAPMFWNVLHVTLAEFGDKMFEKVKGLITDMTDLVFQLSRSGLSRLRNHAECLAQKKVTGYFVSLFDAMDVRKRNISTRAGFEDKSFEKVKGSITDLINIVLQWSRRTLTTQLLNQHNSKPRCSFDVRHVG